MAAKTRHGNLKMNAETATAGFTKRPPVSEQKVRSSSYIVSVIVHILILLLLFLISGVSSKTMPGSSGEQYMSVDIESGGSVRGEADASGDAQAVANTAAVPAEETTEESAPDTEQTQAETQPIIRNRVVRTEPQRTTATNRSAASASENTHRNASSATNAHGTGGEGIRGPGKTGNEGEGEGRNSGDGSGGGGEKGSGGGRGMFPGGIFNVSITCPKSAQGNTAGQSAVVRDSVHLKEGKVVKYPRYREIADAFNSIKGQLDPDKEYIANITCDCGAGGDCTFSQ